jgi:hypothetical protein
LRWKRPPQSGTGHANGRSCWASPRKRGWLSVLGRTAVLADMLLVGAVAQGVSTGALQIEK